MQNDLSRIPLFASIPERELLKLAEIIEVKYFDKGEVLFWEGEPARGLYFIKVGSVQISKISMTGKQTILQIFSTGEVLAEAVLFAEAPYPATAEALEPSTVYFLSTGSMQEVMLLYPRIALNIIKVLSARLRSAQEKLKLWSFAKAENRIAKLLLELATHHGSLVEEGLVVDVEMTHARLAALTGLTRETVSRVLSAWRTDQIIASQQRKIIILDVDTLKEYGEE